MFEFLVIVNVKPKIDIRKLRKTTTSTAMEKSLNKWLLNEQYNGCTRAFFFFYISLPSSVSEQRDHND